MRTIAFIHNELRNLRVLHKRKAKQKSIWEHIGTWTVCGWETGEATVPKWILKEENKFRHKHGSSTGLYRLTLQGHTFEYMIAFGGQGGSIAYYYRRKRRKK